MNPSNIEIAASICFALALIHTFLTPLFKKWAHKFKDGSIAENFLHLLGEVEVVFGLWAGVLLLCFIPLEGLAVSLNYFETRRYQEPVFVFVVMCICATVPLTHFASKTMLFIARLLPLPNMIALYLSCLILGPLLGSFITEPAAMTVTALLMKKFFFDKPVSERFKYKTLGALFVNISIGGLLTPYAAPPVLMVASKWEWDLSFMLTHFGYKAVIVCFLVAVLTMASLRQEFKKIAVEKIEAKKSKVPIWLVLVHLVFLIALVAVHDRIVLVMGIFLFFLGVVTVSKEYQESLKLGESLLVGFFLGGLVILGGLQSWWISPLLASLSPGLTFVGSAALTAITDNAAITFLGAQVPNPSELFKYVLVAGAVSGGGLTVIANAPNPAGFSILQSSFGEDGIQHGQLFKAAMIPTLIALIIMWFL